MIYRIIWGILVLLLSVSCQKDDQKDLKPIGNTTETKVMKDDQNLRLMVWQGFAPPSFIQEFEEEIFNKYNTKVSLIVYHADNPESFFEAIRSQSVDLVTIPHYMMRDEKLNFIRNGLIIRPDLGMISNYKHLIPLLRYKDYHTEQGFLYSIPVASGPYGLAYNSDVFSEAPTSWSIFWQPSQAGKYILGETEYLFNTCITALALGYPLEKISSFDSLNNWEFNTKLGYLADNAHHYWKGTDTPEDYEGINLAMTRGQSLSELNRRGDHWKITEPLEGTPWWIIDYALTSSLEKNPFKKMIAEEWINKVLSPEFQLNQITRELGLYPVVSSISDRMTEEERKKIDFEIYNNSSNSYILQTVYSQRYRNGLSLLWSRANSITD